MERQDAGGRYRPYCNGGLQMEADDFSPPADRPVFICFEDIALARDLATRLRENGLRARRFADHTLMANASAGQKPLAIVADGPRADGLRAVLAATAERPELIAVLSDDGLRPRLEAAQAGFDACLRRPVNVAAPLHHLQSYSADAGATRRLALAGNLSDPLREVVDVLPDTFAVEHFPPANDLLPAVERFRPDVIIVDGDAARPAAELLVLGVRQYEPLATAPLLVATAGDKRRFDALATRVGLEGLIGLPIATADFAAIVGARAERARRLRTAQDYLARSDPLTGLFNRNHFLELLAQAAAVPAGGRMLSAVFHVGITITASNEPQVQATAVAEAADLLRREMPPDAVAARLGDDAFGILVTGTEDAVLQALQQRLLTALGGDRLARVGLAIADAGRGSATALLDRARDNAAPERQCGAPSAADGHWAEAVRAALSEHRFRLVYQPISSLSGHPGALFGVFVRLIDSQGREVLPGEFLATARAADLGAALDRWVLSRAAHVIAEQDDVSHPHLFVKLLPETLTDPGFTTWLGERLRAEGADGRRLVLEISHAALRDQREPLGRLRAAMAPLGCALALEHYDDELDTAPGSDGAGFQYLKLSHRLTEHIATDPDRLARIGRVTAHCRGGGILTVASLVQDAAALSTLWQAGVDYIQGYFMQAPSDIFADRPEQP